MTAQTTPIPLVCDRDRLVDALRREGIRYLAGGTDAESPEGLEREVLLASLAAHEDPRLRLALIPFFLLHPEAARQVPALVEEIPPQAALELRVFSLAAAYLQRIWRIRLGFYLETREELSDRYSGELGLPAAEERYGKAGLYALAEWHARHSPYPYNWLASYQKVADLLFEQLKSEAKR